MEEPLQHDRDKARRQRMRYAERKLKEAQRRVARANRSVVYWSRIIADLRHERTRAVQPPLWPEGELEELN
jgi:capsule polysaccharide export protein KpsE/RkpR